MKLLSLNTHSLEEENMEAKQDAFCKLIEKEAPDIIALQEVNQTMHKDLLAQIPAGFIEMTDVPLRKDNHAAALAEKLHKAGMPYFWCWLPAKVGYDKYDEGLAIFSKKPIVKTENILVSSSQDYHNYRTRRVLGAETEDGWFYSVHFLWWNDPDEPFACQWQKLLPHLKKEKPVYLMGDFNGDAGLRKQTWDLVQSSGFHDTYLSAENKDEGATIGGMIDGWENNPDHEPKRIDQIWSAKPEDVKQSRTVFNGLDQPEISDHYGLLVAINDTVSAKQERA